VAVTQLLDWIEGQIDLDHVAAVEERHIKSLSWEPVDRPPLTLSGPVAEPFAVYPYSEAFQDPTKMLVNELVGPYAAVGPSPSIVNSVMVKDDYPLQIRAFYGVGLFASFFGVQSEVAGDGFPWVRPIGFEKVKQLVAHGIPDLKGGLFQRTLDTMSYYKGVLEPYPKCRKAIHITQPDLQGPFDVADQMWGGDIFTAFYDCPDFFRELLDLLGEMYTLACRRFAVESSESIWDDYIYLHFTIVKGRGLLKDDSSIMLSPNTYTEFIRPVNEKVIQALGTAGIHWCGNGDQWRSDVVSTKGLTCIDWGNPDLIDLPAWADILRERRLPVARMEWRARDFFEVAPTRLFPTGASFTVTAEDAAQFGRLKEMLYNGAP
jgi:hypothetical protein